MGLAAQQRLLAALYTKGSARRAFSADREAVARSFGLEESDRPFWEALDPAQVGRFARSLIAKRFGEAARLIPGTVTLLGEQAARRAFGAYAEEAATEGHRRHLADALGFLDWLRREGGSLADAPAWFRDVIRLERLRLRVAPPGWRFAAARLGYDLRGWSPPGPPPRCRTLILGVRPGRRPFRAVWLRLGRARRVS
jgi:hypothetical protein